MTPEDLFRIQNVRSVAMSPDGRYAAVEISRQGQPIGGGRPTGDLWLADLTSGSFRMVPAPRQQYLGAFNAAWSPGGERLAFLTVDDSAVVRLWVWEPSSAHARVIAGLDLHARGNDPSFVWLDDRRLVARAWHPAAEFGYSMGAGAALQLAIRHAQKVNRLVAASVAYDVEGWQPAFREAIPQMNVEMILEMPFAEEYRQLAPNPDGFRGLAEKLIALEHQPMAWEQEVRALRTPVLIISGDADVVTLEHSAALFHLLGGGIMGDMGQPLPASRLAVMPATSHTAVITQPDLLHAFIEPFLKGETPKGMFE